MAVQWQRWRGLKGLQRFAAVVGAAAMPSMASGQAGGSATLGPKDSAGLPALDTGRVAIGTSAPDFTLEKREGGTLTLSHFREIGRAHV